MRIAVASGKGGTGKTTVATNLALTASAAGRSVGFLDCDVEEPNGALFLKPQFAEARPVLVSIPEVDVDRCNGCGQCGRICQYGAIVPLDKQVLVFPELCHACGGCWLVCPAGAIVEAHRQIGKLEWGRAGEVHCVQGELEPGETMGPPVIAAVRRAAPEVDLLVTDAPPGTSSPAIAGVRDSDLVLLVTEPTPFGLNDLRLAVDMVRALKLPLAVVINRADIGDSQTRLFCEYQRIDLLAQIPDDRQVAEAYSRGVAACDAIPEYRQLYRDLWDKVEASTRAQTGHRDAAREF